MSALPTNWVKTRLEDVCEILDSKRIPINSSERRKRIEGKSPKELYPYYGATGQVDVIDGYLFEGEHVLIGEDGAPFLDPIKPKAYMVGGRFWVNNHAHILRSQSNNRFLCEYLNHIRYEDHVNGTTRLKLTKSALVAIPISFPPLAEQRRIVAKIEELFSELDKGVETLTAARAQLKAYRQSVLKHAFEGKLTEDWRAKNADKLEAPETLLARIKQEREARYKQALEDWQSALATWRANGEKGKRPGKPKRQSDAELEDDFLLELPALPTAWMWAALNDLSEQISDGTHKTPSYTLTGVPFVSAKDIRNFQIDFSETRFVDKAQHQEMSKRCFVKRGNVLITKSGTIGRVAVVSTDFEFSLFESVANIPLIAPMNSKFVSLAVFYIADAYFVRKAQKGVAVRHLHLEDIRKMPLPLMSTTEQAEIVRRLEEKLEAADVMEAEIEAALARAGSLRQAILKRAFSGKLVPQDPHDEPAATLLARIRAEREAAPVKKTTRRKTQA